MSKMAEMNFKQHMFLSEPAYSHNFDKVLGKIEKSLKETAGPCLFFKH